MRVVGLWRLNASLVLLLDEKAMVTSFLDNHSKNEVWQRTYQHCAKSLHRPLLTV